MRIDFARPNSICQITNRSIMWNGQVNLFNSILSSFDCKGGGSRFLFRELGGRRNVHGVMGISARVTRRSISITCTELIEQFNAVHQATWCTTGLSHPNRIHDNLFIQECLWPFSRSTIRIGSCPSWRGEISTFPRLPVTTDPTQSHRLFMQT